MVAFLHVLPQYRYASEENTSTATRRRPGMSKRGRARTHPGAVPPLEQKRLDATFEKIVKDAMDHDEAPFNFGDYNTLKRSECEC